MDQHLSGEVSANDMVDVKDIKGMFLYTKTNYIFAYLRIYQFNLDLLTQEEMESLTNRLAVAFDGDRKDFSYNTLPRELDLDQYKAFLKEKRIQEMESLGKKHIIDEMLLKATELSSSNENYEHQHYYKFWRSCEGGQAQAEAELRERVVRIRDVYRDASISCEILMDKEIIKLCNLYSNSRSANYDVIGSMIQPSIPMLR